MASTESELAPPKLSLVEKLGYALGDAAANFVLQMRLNFLTIFYTDVYGIAPSAVALMQFFSHVVDGFNDIVMGALSDRTRTRWGKFRPWILWSAIPLGVASYLVFAAPALSATGRIVYASLTLLMMIIAYGANNVPYSALGGVISDDPDERVNVASWRMSFAMLAALFVLKFSQDWIDRIGGSDPAHGYRVVAALWAVLAILCSLTTFFMTRERIEPVEVEQASLRTDLGALFSNKAWRVLALSSLLIYICLGMRGTICMFYFQYAMLNKPLYGNFNAVGMVGAIVGIFMSSALTERYGKRNAFCSGLAISAILMISFYFVQGDQVWLTLAFQFAFQVAFGATIPIMWGMIADVADYTEWQSSKRITALTFAATLFFFKIGQGIGATFAASMLSAIGYVPNSMQAASTTQGIRLMFSVLPAALFLAAAAIMLRYVITQDMEREMTTTLRERREQLASTEV